MDHCCSLWTMFSRLWKGLGPNCWNSEIVSLAPPPPQAPHHTRSALAHPGSWPGHILLLRMILIASATRWRQLSRLFWSLVAPSIMWSLSTQPENQSRKGPDEFLHIWRGSARWQQEGALLPPLPVSLPAWT